MPSGEKKCTGFRVAALIDTAAVSGPGRQLAALALELRQHGVELRVFMLQRIGFAYPYSEYLARMGVACTVVTDRGPFDLSLVRLMAKALSDWGPDIVQTHNYRTTVTVGSRRVLDISIATVNSTFQLIVSPSAYPHHYGEALASDSILPLAAYG